MSHKRTDSSSNHKRLKFPYNILRPLFGSLSMLLFLFSLHSLIYISFIAYNSPDCSKCAQNSSDKNCNNYCDITVDDFVFVYDKEDRSSLLIYVGVVLLLRCFAFLSAFIGIFQLIVYVLIVYLILHFGLIMTFLATIGFFALEEKRVFEYVFGRTTTSIVVLSIAYTLEGILFFMGLILSYKLLKIRLFKCKNKDKSEAKPKPVKKSYL